MMAFTIQILAGGFALLGLQFMLLLTNPVKFRNRIQAEGVETHVDGRGDAELAIREDGRSKRHS